MTRMRPCGGEMSVKANGGVRKGSSERQDPARAVEQLFDQIDQPDASLGVFFCSAGYDLKQLERALSERARGMPLIGCTSAGEITPAGYVDGAITGFTLAEPDFRTASAPIFQVNSFSISDGNRIANELRDQLDRISPSAEPGDTFAFLMIDGLCQCEEIVVSALYSALGEIPLFGASSGSNSHFTKTHVYFDGAFRSDMAVLTLVRTIHPFKLFTTDHFIPSDTKMVITEADSASRVVTEINAEPSGPEYARLVGLSPDDLTPMIFAMHPVVVKVGGRYYTRSIRNVNEDGSLTFFCAVDKGVVLTLSEGTDIISNLSDTFDKIHQEIGPTQLVIGCECVLRILEIEKKQLKSQASRIMVENNVIGFGSYGEEFQAMHLNQTFTGAAIGIRRDRS